MKLSQFHTLVSSALKRGTALDSQIPSYVPLAVQWLERNYTFKYMEQFRLLQMAIGDRTIQMPANKLIKSARFIRMVGEDGLYSYLNKVEAADLDGLRSSNNTPRNANTVPSSYFMVGNSTLVLDAVPSAVINGEAIFYEYTDWPTDDNSQPELLQFAADAILAQTLWYMAIFALKDLRMAEPYKVARDEALNTLTRAEDENQYGGADLSMAYLTQ